MYEIILEFDDYLIGSFEGYLNGTVHFSFTEVYFVLISYVIFIFIQKSGKIYFVYEIILEFEEYLNDSFISCGAWVWGSNFACPPFI